MDGAIIGDHAASRKPVKAGVDRRTQAASLNREALVILIRDRDQRGASPPFVRSADAPGATARAFGDFAQAPAELGAENLAASGLISSFSAIIWTRAGGASRRSAASCAGASSRRPLRLRVRSCGASIWAVALETFPRGGLDECEPLLNLLEFRRGGSRLRPRAAQAKIGAQKMRCSGGAAAQIGARQDGRNLGSRADARRALRSTQAGGNCPPKRSVVASALPL